MNKIIKGYESHKKLAEIFSELGVKKYMLVCGSSIRLLKISSYLRELKIPSVRFSGFKPNPSYDEVCEGVELFKKEKCDAILAVGGGSAIDVAKCIKLFSGMPSDAFYLKEEFRDTGVPLIAIPTTAGTGSESTRFSVIYYEGNKYSVVDDSIIPDYAILDYEALKPLPLYQKKCTMLDALCQAIESLWSVNSNEESRELSRLAINLIRVNKYAFLYENSDESCEKIMLASNYAGRAINITTTTAAHAMSYKLTSCYDIPHGHAVAVCLLPLFKHMAANTDKCRDPRGKEHLSSVLFDIAKALGTNTIEEGIEAFRKMLSEMEISGSEIPENDVEMLSSTVNAEKLKNHPVELDKDTISKLYYEIIKNEK